MKKIYNLLALVAVIGSLSACRPLDKTYDELGGVPAPTASAVTASLTLSAADYGLLPATNYAKTSLSFKIKDDAAASIPTILASKYPTYGEKSSIAVTYGVTNPSIKLADSVNANVAITLQVGPPSDYRWTAFTYKGANISANNFDDLSASAALNWLKFKNQTPPADYTIRVLTYLYFESNVTASTGTLTTDAFIYTAANDWQKIYCVKPAQYATVNRGVNNAFVTADAANIPSILGAFLKADAAVMATAKAADVIYVNYKYQTSATVSYQRVLPLTFDGSNWVTTPTPATLQFLKTNGTWVADNTVTYKLTTADYAQIKTMPTTINIQTALDNVASFGDFNVSTPLSSTTGWTDAQVNACINLILLHDFPTAVANQKFVITYVAYNGSTFNVTKTFVYNSGAFTVAP
ncbi:hypothetical protein C8P68_106274 [Mucilaginibacter yixingensis]|uniref:DUF5017 domain-containing protein n=1 Tax=Mucilaginibacter yixingensis TaxID=1295612 RepID=A0A2T5J7H7_9SPHI|nr:hypothetical protein [Mucilaginibacter yixingensis]PTQ95059.1 hypothetical protein C8P68_106274 [Mucilaginibacter yixingensis]